MIVLQVLALTFVVCVNGHGRIMDPPGRNAMWRFGFTNPVNYNDNEVYCGGFGVQTDKYGGKCGVCGDEWGQEPPREHEAGGKYGKGIIGKRYVMGQTIDIEVDLTTNHWGHFELKLCPVKNKKEITTQACMDRHPLVLADDPSTYKFEIPKKVGKKGTVKYQVKLPKGITCRQCVIQWTYFTGNTWGICPNNTGAVGCGPQEMFRNCADVQIYSQTVGIPPWASVSYPNAIYFRDKAAPGGRRPYINKHQLCLATGLYKDQPDMDKWCQQNCLKYPEHCPADKCECFSECHGINELADVEGTDVYCQYHCLRYPPDCPRDQCECTPDKKNEGSLYDNNDKEVIVEEE